MKNTLLQKLGFGLEDRVVLFHCDDIGMNLGSVQAYQDLKDFGLARSGSVMVNCPWFLSAANLAKSQSDADLGVHLMLTSEWQEYRWRPLTNPTPESGLVDAEGFFHRSEYTCWSLAQAEAVEQEVVAQVEAALRVGMPISHLDSHMFAMLSAKTLPIFYRVAQRYNLPMMALHSDYLNRVEPFIKHTQMQRSETPLVPEWPDVLATTWEMEQADTPLFDNWCSLPYKHADDRVGHIKHLLTELPAGVSFFMLHPSLDTPELRAICPGADWQIRVADYHAMLSKELQAFIKRQGIHLISFKDIQALLSHKGSHFT
ncbi:ChbG/HpnK family deacetylase [Motilimonas sp. E26]|uniref:ChbG/HpnK family deacetylase n=1 Tax=Motilimonas sp. E26 TaxID=2865674 RepID=UPI001E305100|nr:ChbG/HpnK family deacetylase [Motilimonas sp. E26]MCE0558928.1 ChbG/HpnK family deacetylase [Motilimonas sp. E26]